MSTVKDDADSDDDWIFETVQTYKNLYMYDLMHRVTAMDWVTGKSVCIATSDSRKHELVELSVPDRVLQYTADEMGLVKDRDFHLNAGGFSEDLITAVKHIPNTRLVVTSPDTLDGHIELWQLGSNDTDMMHRTDIIKGVKENGCPAKLCILSDTADILFGSHVDNICLVDMETKKVKVNSMGLKKTQKISSIDVSDPNTIVCCCEESGDLCVLDLRDKLSKVKAEYSNGAISTENYFTGCCHENFYTGVSSDGQIKISDMRHLDTNLAIHDTGLYCVNKEHICIKNAAKNDGLEISLSGFDGKVYLYSVKITETSQKHQSIKPIFVHEGHERNNDSQSKSLKVVSHLLHPWQKELFLSAATDGSLHAWEFNKDFKNIK